MSKIGICIAGCGWMGKVHAQGYATLADSVDVYYLSRTEKRAKEYIEKFGGKGYFTDFDEVLASDAVDAVDICLPHDQHLDRILRSFDAGKHVITEKPMSMNLADADQMVAAARKADRRFMVAENFRYYPHLVRAAQLVRKREVGEVFLIQVNFLAHYVVGDWRREMASAGGGVLIDVGHHFIDLAVMLGGKVEKVYAQFSNRSIQAITMEDTAILNLTFRSGKIGVVNLSFGTPHVPSQPMFLACGPKGTIYFDNEGLFVHKDKTLHEVMAKNEEGLDGGLWSESIRLGAQDFAKSMLSNRAPRMTGEMGRHDMAIIEAATKSAASGAVVAVD